MSPDRGIVGWDLGGAHLKVAWLDASGAPLWFGEWATPLWQGLDALDAAIDELGARVPLHACEHRLTMTGELVDRFADRAEGVAALSAHMRGRLPAGRLRIYAGEHGFVAPDAAPGLSDTVASANWHATLTWLAAQLGDGLLVDVGSTTSDVLAFAGGQPRHRGYRDRERLASDELVYAGVVRTPLMAITQRVPFAGEWQGLANEHFATTADVYRILGWLPEHADLHPSADGRDKSPRASMRRLARMVGADLGDADDAAWHALAAYFADRQLDALTRACRTQLGRGVPPDAPLIGAGVGDFLVRRLAARLERAFLSLNDLIGIPRDDGDDTGIGASTCAPAVAVARLGFLERLACAC